MEKTILTGLKKNHLLQETLSNTTALPACAYFVYTCFASSQKSTVLFLIVSGFGAALSLGFGHWHKLFVARHVLGVLSAGRIDTHSESSLIQAKNEAYRLPRNISLSFLFRWGFIGTFCTVLPYIIIAKIPAMDFLYISMLLFFVGLGTIPYVYLSTESGVSDFLRVSTINDLDRDKLDLVRLPLTPKIILMTLSILVPPLGILFTVIIICQVYSIPPASIRFGFFIVIVQSLFYSILTSVMFARNIKLAVDEVIHILKDMSRQEGDLTRTIRSASNDEIGELAYWFNRFTGNLRVIISNIVTNAGSLDHSSEALSTYSSDMTKGADDMARQSNVVAAAAEEMSVNISSVSAFMEQAAANVDIVAAATEEMTVSITEIAENSEKARNVANNAVSFARSASDKVDQLGEAAKDITKITGVISEISEQTNLLALNATIEAARAGDAGRSFAVVAAEIKELATQTANATHEIRKKIQGIQYSTSDTITEIKKIADIINDVNEIVSGIASSVEEQAVTTREIAGNIAQASRGNQEVSQRVAESSSASNTIADEISAVSRSAGDMTRDCSRIQKNAEDLAGLSDILKKMVNRFRI